jgi:hypothetical protein
MATETIAFGSGGMTALSGRTNWGLVEDPGHDKIRVFGEVGGIGEFNATGEKKPGAEDASVITGAGNAATIPTGAVPARKPTLDEFLNTLTGSSQNDLVKNRDSLLNDYQGLLGDIKDPLLKSILAKLFMALLSDPPDLATLATTAEKLKTYVATQDFLSGKSNKVPPEVMRLLESKYGKWNGIGKNVDPTRGTGPNGGRLLRDTIRKMLECDDASAKQSYSAAQKTASPIMFDLTGLGKIETTGESTAKVRNPGGAIGKTVAFDIDGDGAKDQIEWMAGNGQGMLVDDRQGQATAAEAGTRELTGKDLFGDAGGFNSGYDKLRLLDANGDGKLSGDELKGLKMWIDDGDAKVEAGEMKTLAELGITEISVQNKAVQNDRGESLDQASFVQNGQSKLTEDVWFAKK